MEATTIDGRVLLDGIVRGERQRGARRIEDATTRVGSGIVVDSGPGGGVALQCDLPLVVDASTVGRGVYPHTTGVVERERAAAGIGDAATLARSRVVDDIAGMYLSIEGDFLYRQRTFVADAAPRLRGVGVDLPTRNDSGGVGGIEDAPTVLGRRVVTHEADGRSERAAVEDTAAEDRG